MVIKVIRILTQTLDKTQKTKGIIDLYDLLKESNEVELLTLKNNLSVDAKILKNKKELKNLIKNSDETVITNSLYISNLLGKKGNSKNKIYYISDYLIDEDVNKIIKKTKNIDNVVSSLKSNYVLLNKKVNSKLTYIYDIVKENNINTDGLTPLVLCNTLNSYKRMLNILEQSKIEKANIVCNFNSIVKNDKYKIYYNLSDKLYKKANIFISIDNNIRLYILEAFSYKIPVITYNDLELKEIVSNNWDGYLVENEDRLITKIIALNSNENRKIIMSNNAIKKADKFSYLIVKEKWRKVVNYERDNT